MQVGSLEERVGIDIVGPLRLTERCNRYFLVMVDYFTKAVKAKALPNQEAETVAFSFLNSWVAEHRVPDSIISDQGLNFESAVFSHFCTLLGVHKTRTTPGNPHGNSQVENTNDGEY